MKNAITIVGKAGYAPGRPAKGIEGFGGNAGQWKPSKHSTAGGKCAAARKKRFWGPRPTEECDVTPETFSLWRENENLDRTLRAMWLRAAGIDD